MPVDLTRTRAGMASGGRVVPGCRPWGGGMDLWGVFWVHTCNVSHLISFCTKLSKDRKEIKNTY